MTGLGALDDAALFRRYRRGDLAARDELTTRYLPRTRAVARRLRSRGEPLDDLEQVASVGLVKALDRFDPGQGAAFWTYALPTVAGEVKRYYRDSCWTVHVPRAIQERSLLVQREVTRLGGVLGRSPTAREIATSLELTLEHVVEALEAGSAFDPRSLDTQPAGADEDAGTYSDLLGAPDDGLEAAEERALVAPALRALAPRDRLILRLRFEEDLTQTEIAERVGISQMHVSRLIRRALDCLREAITADEPVAPRGLRRAG